MTTTYTRPERILWSFPSATAETWIDALPSKSLRKIARRLDEIAAAERLTFSWDEMTDELYADFYAYYARIMPLQGKRIVAQPSWFTTRRAQGVSILLLRCYRQGSALPVGQTVIVRTAGGLWNGAYKASERVQLSSEDNLSLGALIELEFIRRAFSQGATQVHSGRSRNAFGFRITIGYLLFKLRSGYRPVIEPGVEAYQDFPQTEGKPTVWIVVEAGQIESPVFLTSHPPDAYPSELKHFCTKLGIELRMIT